LHDVSPGMPASMVPNFILNGQTVPEHGYSRRVTRLLGHVVPGQREATAKRAAAC